MKIIRWVIWIVCSAFIILNILELYDVLNSRSVYITNQSNPVLGIHISRELYISLLLFMIMSLIAMIYFSYKRRWHIFFVGLLVALLLEYVIFNAWTITPAP